MLDDNHSDLQSSLTKAHEALKRELAKLRAGRANPDLLANLRADYYGTATPLTQMANISVPEARLILVKPWDKSAVKAVEKAIRESNLGLNPQVDGDVIRVPLPPLTEERRREFVKIAKKYGEDCKVSIRKARHDAMDVVNELVDSGDASEDEGDRAKKKVEEVVSEAGKQVDVFVAQKEKDIMEV